jgi:membrane protease YdiL (CAAX protease family)
MNAHLSTTAVIQHAPFLFLLVAAPAWDYYDTRRVKRNANSTQKIRYYKTLCAWLWAASILAVIAVGWRSLFTIHAAPGDMGWLLQHIWVRYFVAVALFAVAAIVVWTYLAVLIKRVRHEPRKYAAADLMQKVSYAHLIPATRVERRWWVLIGLTAGICEEILFRGFLLHYLHTFPWQLNLRLALGVSALIFGLQHLYQGANGVVTTALLGALFALLFLLSGSLLLPMLLHTALDLRLLVILRPATD